GTNVRYTINSKKWKVKNMTKKNGLFVKINYKNTNKHNAGAKRHNSEINNSTYMRKFLYCAGVLNKNGGTMIFRAKDMDEADYIAHNNPFVGCETYAYEISHGDVISL
ncbi:MAG: hypothetical protein Q8930_20645, partial [Bacillota bacterium]|nr:hypothetical protein [Bacillota bacterium]